MVDKLLEQELFIIKKNINTFLDCLTEDLEKKNIRYTKKDTEFIRYITKQIVFLKIIAFDSTYDLYRANLISDYYYFLNSILSGQLRYVYLNKRSIIENYIRLIKKVEDGKVTTDIFMSMKTDSEYLNISNDEFSLLRSEFSVACDYVHGGKKWGKSLVEDYFSCTETLYKLENPYYGKNFYKNTIQMIKIMNKMILSVYIEEIRTSFYRKNDIIEYLNGKKYYELYKNIKEEPN